MRAMEGDPRIIVFVPGDSIGQGTLNDALNAISMEMVGSPVVRPLRAPQGPAAPQGPTPAYVVHATETVRNDSISIELSSSQLGVRDEIGKYAYPMGLSS